MAYLNRLNQQIRKIRFLCPKGPIILTWPWTLHSWSFGVLNNKNIIIFVISFYDYDNYIILSKRNTREKRRGKEY